MQTVYIDKQTLIDTFYSSGNSAMAEKDQVKPLAPSAYRIGSHEDEDQAISMELKTLKQRKYIKCCGCITALLLIQAVILLILFFTVFRVKDPVIKMNSVKIVHLELVNGTTPKPGVNITLMADVSVKNPNVASFKYSNTTTTIYYGGVVVGEAKNPAGKAKARRTMRMNLTIDIMPDKILGVQSLSSDIQSRKLSMNSYTKVGGRVKILHIIKRHVVVKMNCSMTMNLTSQSIQEQKCKRHVSL